MKLQLDNISFSYPTSKKNVIDNLSLTLTDKKITAIMGASGAGKSTLLRIIVGLETPQLGRILLNDEILKDESINIPTEYRNIGMVFQNYVLFPHMTVYENIAFGLGSIKNISKEQKMERCQEILNLIEMSSFRDTYPQHLSGGQQQRVALGRALAPMPKLLLLDEPFSNLDAFLRNKIQKELQDILQRAQVTTILVTHNVSDLQIADHIVLLSPDTIKTGSLTELRDDTNCPLVNHLLG